MSVLAGWLSLSPQRMQIRLVSLSISFPKLLRKLRGRWNPAIAVCWQH